MSLNSKLQNWRFYSEKCPVPNADRLIAQGLLQYLALSFRRVPWNNFNSYIRTAKTHLPPSEWVVAQAPGILGRIFCVFHPKLPTSRNSLSTKLPLGEPGITTSFNSTWRRERFTLQFNYFHPQIKRP